MTTLEFKDALTENPFINGNSFMYGTTSSFGLYFSQDSKYYPFVMKSRQSDSFELRYSDYTYQLRSRLLNTKKIKEVLDSAKLPLIFNVKRKWYLIGKGFLSTYSPDSESFTILFIACVDGTKQIGSISQVKFLVSKEIYSEEHKALQPAIKDIVGGHSGDVIMCNDVLDYTSEKLTFPSGGGLRSLTDYKNAVVQTVLSIIGFRNRRAQDSDPSGVCEPFPSDERELPF